MKKICSFVLMTSMIVGVIIAKNLSPLGMSTLLPLHLETSLNELVNGC